jgi:hypothetical protein
MKSLIFGVALCAAALPALAQTNVSISVGQPGFYGRVDLGNFAPAPVVYAPQPVIIERGPAYVAEPIYLRVPPGHRMHWARYCGRYNACGRPVLFVRDEWYTRSYVPAYREHYRPVVEYREPHRMVREVERVEYRDHDRGRHEGWEHGRGGEWRDHGEGRGEGRDHGEGHGERRGEGHGHGHGRD